MMAGFQARSEILSVQVWHLDINLTILDHAGNLTDACLLSAVAALMVFRRPEVEVDTSNSSAGNARTLLLSSAVREPLPLVLHQLPLSTTFALFGVISWSSRNDTAPQDAMATLCALHRAPECQVFSACDHLCKSVIPGMNLSIMQQSFHLTGHCHVQPAQWTLLCVLTQEAAERVVVMQAGEAIVVDPSFKEEAAASGEVTIIVNTNSDVCTIRKTSGVGIPVAQVCAGSVSAVSPLLCLTAL